MHPISSSINELFEEQVRRTPDRIAAVCAERRLTYAALNAEANRLAHFLQEQAIGPEMLVGIFMERSIDALIGLLGVMKTGAAFVPLEPTLPSKRLEYQLAEINASVLLTCQTHLPSLARFDAKVVCLDQDEHPFKQYPATNLKQTSAPDNIAYVIYTSGSTGFPKGVAITHRNLLNYTEFICNRLGLYDTETLNFALVSILGTDLGNTCLFPSLVSGGCLHILKPEIVKDAVAFASYISSHEIDVLKITPSHLNALLAGQRMLDVLPRKFLILGGEILSFELCERLAQSSPRCKIINHYGPTETTVGALCTEVNQLDHWSSSSLSVPIGKPISRTSVHILNADLKPVSEGESGELYIGGDGVGRGYLDRPELTAQAFLCDPFSQTPGARLYKTGDLCRYLPDGKIEFIGRIDRQIKIRGFRVEIEEIEAALRKHPLVCDVVVTSTVAAERKRLIACVILADESLSDSTEAAGMLRRHLQDSLEPFMIPSEFVFLKQFPLTESGKLDYKQLPVSSNHGNSTGVKDGARQGWAEVCMTSAWRKYLNLAQISIRDNFIDLGGDSIIAIQISAELYQQGIHLTPQQFFDNQTIADQLKVYKAAQFKKGHAEIDSAVTPVPLTPIQKWFFEQDFPEAHYWNQSVLLEVEERLDAALLKTAVESLTKRHGCFGLSFLESEAGWQQLSGRPRSEIPFQFKSLKHHSASTQRVMIEDIARQAQAALNISEAPLLRVILFDLGEDRSHRLLIIIHHLVVDGVSWRILIEDLQHIYHQLSRAVPVESFEETTSFQEWSAQLTTFAQSPALDDELPYWRKIRDRKFTSIPKDYGKGDNSEGTARTIWSCLSRDETQYLLKGIPAKIHISLHAVLLSALARVITAWTGSPNMLIDVEGHGREELIPDLNLTQTAGWFTSLFPLALESQPDDSFDETLLKVQAALLELPNRGSGYGLLRYLSDNAAVREEMASMAQAEICFNYLGQFNQTSGRGFKWGPAPEFPGATRHPSSARGYALKISARIVDEQFYLDWSFSHNIHAFATVYRLAEDYLNELRNVIAQMSGGATLFDDHENKGLIYNEVSFSGLPITTPSIRYAEDYIYRGDDQRLEPSRILLTGATGFLGSYLLRELLRQTRAQVYCLIRGESRDEALQRISERLQWYFPDDDYDTDLSRVNPIAGDIRSPQLGLSSDEYHQLRSIDTIFHAAADVRLIGNPRELFETNVAGTRNILALTTEGKAKQLHHISTLSVVGNSTNSPNMSFSENDLDIGQQFNNPYEESKFEAEKLVKEAVSSGVHAVIYRFGNIAADSITGKFQTNIAQNRIYLSLKSFIQTGLAPYLPHTRVSFSYVDVVAKGIVALSLLPSTQGQVFHVENSNKISYYDLLRVLQSFGYSIMLLNPDEYVRRTSSYGQDHEHLYSRNSIWGHQELNQEASGIEIDSSRTEAALKQLKIEFPPYSTRWLRKMNQHCINVNFLKAPSYWDNIISTPDILMYERSAPLSISTL
jgi:amino acid adenylation domain-containing protein/thioester reductase-like protein/non-ribosomal peptide synthase protein (TIGR01720 family)